MIGPVEGPGCVGRDSSARAVGRDFIGSDKSPLAEQAASEPLDLGRPVTAVAHSGQRSVSHSPFSFCWQYIAKNP